MRVGVLSYPMLFQRQGGLQVQVIETINALRTLGVDAHLVDPNKDLLSAFDVIHVFSAINGNHRIVEAAKSQGRPVVLSPLIRPSWNVRSGRIAAALERVIGRLTRWHVETSYRQISSALANADRIVALGEIEKASIKTAFREPDEKILVTPNGISKRFYEADAKAFCERYGIKEGFVLNVAGVNSHKNQSAIVHALKGYDYPVVLIGWCQKEDSAYLERLTADHNVNYLGPLSNDDPLLASAYAAAGVFVLPSFDEVMPLSVLESLAAGTPVVMTNRHSMCIDNSSGVIHEHDPSDIESIRRSVLHFLKSPPAARLCRSVVEDYSWERVAKKLLTTYEEALTSKRTRR